MAARGVNSECLRRRGERIKAPRHSIGVMAVVDLPFDKKLRFLETFVTIGGFLTLISAISPPTDSNLRLVTVVLLAIFMLSAITVYKNLLFEKGYGNRWSRQRMEVTIPVLGLSLSFALMLALLIQEPLSELLFGQPIGKGSPDWETVILTTLTYLIGTFSYRLIRDSLLFKSKT